MEKKAFKSHSQKQDKVSSTGNTMASQNKANPSLIVSFAKSSSSKLFLSSTFKKQSNSL